MPSEPDSSGKATKSDVATMKREAREKEQAYRQGLEDAEDDGSSNGNGESGGSRSGASSQTGPRISFSSDAQKIIIVSMTVTVIVALIENAHQPKGQKGVPSSNIIVGGFVSGALLLGMSYFLPEFASGFAIVAMLSTVLERGKPFWDIIGSVTGTPIPTTSKPERPKGSKPSPPTPATGSGDPKATLV